ncbi:glycosyltransferase [Vibrio mangrovi]|uniref:Glycosyltransferase n=1 Tax=Vibrio mangrovi TaxID=474394 RepID=A0A1Y6IQY4_9VIBR|nr:glycosyltransferase [Vibrio mangrovi]MDW6003735.1 glycosyltransferase [Vibrio mangrovi]SMR99471.1 L-noviosyl transferase [Vibrio mangrovi]
MNILILTYGSRGDVQPYIALGKGLQQTGNQVTLATSVRFQDFVETHDLNYAYMNDDLLSIVDTDDGKDLMEKADNVFEIIKQGIKLKKQVKPANQALLRESWEAAQQADPDFIIYHPKALAAVPIAEKLGIGCTLATPIPMFVPTDAFRFPAFPNLNLGGWYNRFTFHAIRILTNMVVKEYIQDFRKEIGLKPVNKFDSIKTANGGDIPILHIYSEAVVRRPDDWPDCAQVTGYCFLDDAVDWTPPQNLVDFLEAGEPPIYIGFGSMSGRDPERLAKIVIEALQKANLRGIIATGWGGLKTEDLPDTIFKIEQAPHDWLFPKMAAVVHHGGAGTTAAGLRAGKPSVIVPFFGDQPFWGQRVHEIGAGPKSIPQKKLDVASLSEAMHEATTNQAIIKTAKDIGEKIRKEDGIGNAISFIEEQAQLSWIVRI